MFNRIVHRNPTMIDKQIIPDLIKLSNEIQDRIRYAENLSYLPDEKKNEELVTTSPQTLRGVGQQLDRLIAVHMLHAPELAGLIVPRRIFREMANERQRQAAKETFGLEIVSGAVLR